MNSNVRKIVLGFEDWPCSKYSVSLGSGITIQLAEPDAEWAEKIARRWYRRAFGCEPTVCNARYEGRA